MANLRVSNCDEQPDQPFLQQEDYNYRQEENNLVEFDVKYLIRCLNMERNTSYEIVGKPDIENRQSQRPDFLIKDNKTGSLIAIEHARFFEGEKSREKMANSVKKSPFGIMFLDFPTAEQLGKRLSEFISDKLGKGQFEDYSNCERILLSRNRWGGVRLHHFIAAEPYLKLQEPINCDHFFLLVGSRLLEVF